MASLSCRCGSGDRGDDDQRLGLDDADRLIFAAVPVQPVDHASARERIEKHIRDRTTSPETC